MMLRRRSNYLGPVIEEQRVWPGPFLGFNDQNQPTFGLSWARKIGQHHDTGRTSEMKATPAATLATVVSQEGDDRATVVLTFDAVGSEADGDLHVAPLWYSVYGAGSFGLPPDFAAQIRVKDVLVAAIMEHAYVPKREHRPDHNDRRGRGVWVTEHEARDYLAPGRSMVPRGLIETRRAIAEAWWDAKLAGLPVYETVAKRALREGAPASKAARKRAKSRVADVKRRGLLAEVGAERGLRLEDYERIKNPRRRG
ncbi:hypothetical protein BH23ACT2_BH23ACT2_13210 [soil metagenome]